MSWLEKIGLVERDEPEIPVELTVTQEAAPVPAANVDAEINSAANIVADIYAQNDLGDKSDSIYAVQAFIATLPAEMTTAKKQSTVAGILTVSQKPVADLVADALHRMDILRAAKEKIVGERTNEIATANGDIEALKQAIEAATIKIKEAEDIIAATNKSIDDELKTISDLVEFCNGMEAK